MKMTFDEWIKNPTGGSSVMTNTHIYYQLYKEKLDKILVRQAGNIEYALYHDIPGDKFYIYMKVWSEVIKDFSYDVLVEFYSDNVSMRAATSLDKYFVRFYSNDPAFVYTFAHAYNRNGLFIKELEPRMSKLALSEKAKTKNPKDEVGYVKSIFFLYLIAKSRGLFLKVTFKGNGSKVDFKFLNKVIRHSDDKIADRQEEEEKISKSNRIAKQKESVAKANAERVSRNPDMFVGSNTGKTMVGNVHKISPIKPSSSIGKIKKMK